MVVVEPSITQDSQIAGRHSSFREQKETNTGVVRRAVVVHAGARDAYQVAVALSERGMLEALVTDLFWPADHSIAKRLATLLPERLRSLLRQRSAPGLPSTAVRLRAAGGLWTLALEKLSRAPFALRRRSQRGLDASLGKSAGCLASAKGAGLVAYSYYGFDAISNYGRSAMLFQLHPHPATMRRILQRELEDHPDCADSLRQEWELALPDQDYEHLVQEVQMASRFLVASSFTRASLIEHGALPSSITVVPYGVDLDRFRPASGRPALQRDETLQLLFVGRINQRKGIKYLLEALRLLNTPQVHLTVCGRVLDDLALFRPFADRVTIRPSVSAVDLIEAYQSADLFVFPSVAEGFGQVLLESLACGLPVLSTTHTAAPDLIVNGVEGFIVEPRRPDLLADRIAWALEHRRELEEMRQSARTRAEHFTWTRFRQNIGTAVATYLDSLTLESNGHSL
jgi:glycosyltransferase involved in cell wall biosynthesis